MAEQPNDASRKSKAEGERWNRDGREPFDQSDTTQSGIGNRQLDEEITNREPVRREDGDRVRRAGLYTPRRYEQPIEDDHDPVMPSDDATVNTKI